MLRNILVFTIDNIVIIPINSEIILLDNHHIKRNILQYIIGSIIGSAVAYFIGYYLYSNVEFLMEYIFTVITHKQLNIDIINKYLNVSNISQAILIKSCIPILPIAIINIICGHNKVNFVHFIILVTVMRAIRALIVSYIGRFLLRHTLLTIVAYILKVVTISVILNVLFVQIYENCLYI